jgi:hypothetical protein
MPVIRFALCQGLPEGQVARTNLCTVKALLQPVEQEFPEFAGVLLEGRLEVGGQRLHEERRAARRVGGAEQFAEEAGELRLRRPGKNAGARACLLECWRCQSRGRGRGRS